MLALKRHQSSPVKTSSKKVIDPAGGTFAINPDFKLQQTIKVAVRIRPLQTDSENPQKGNGKKSKAGWTLEKSGATDTLIQKGTARKVEGRTIFHFDSVFDEETQTPLLYKSIARPMVKTVVYGKHATLFAYGQTSGGKTFTMQGDGKRSGGQAGIIQLVASDIFRFMKQGESASREFVVKVSYIEIYNETIRDLLSDDAGSTMSHGTGDNGKTNHRGSHLEKVNIRATADGQVTVNCIQNEVSNVDEVLEYLIAGNGQRKVAKTDMNNHSSRSHAIFRLTVESKSKEDIENGRDEIVRVSDFNLVDLAGSESVKMSNTSGIRLREGAKINQSLLSLSTVIHSLSLPDKKRPKHINYRDSKLTRMLQPHLSGNAEIAIVCCISPSKAYTEETRTTLKFASRAKLIHVTPIVNEILDDGAKIKKLQRELEKAKKRIEELSKGQESSKMSTRADLSAGSSLNPQLQTEDISQYGYEDMAQSRNYVMPVQQIPQNYVMPADQETPQEYPMPGMGNPPKDYPMPGQQPPHQQYSMPLNESTDSDSGDSLSENSLPNDNFKLDAVGEEEMARKTVLKYMHGKHYGDSSTEGDDLYSESSSSGTEESDTSLPLDMGVKKDSVNATARTEDETDDGPPANYKDLSLKFGSKMSAPETLGVDPIQEENSKYGTHDGQDGRTNEISWDTIGLNTSRPEHVGQPLRALKSLAEQNKPIPKEVTIISTSLGDGEMGLVEKVEDAQKQSSFLKAKLEASDDIIESVFKDLERARLCIHDLVYRNVELAAKMTEKRRQDVKEEYEEGELNVEQYWLLKGSMYVGLFFFFTGGYEFFMASVMMVWLLLEFNLS